MNPIRLAVMASVLIVALSAGCSSKTTKSLAGTDENLRESRWSATYTRSGESIPLTLILMTPEKPGPFRLVALSAFGATLGDCLVKNGRGKCRNAPGADGLMRQISEAAEALLNQEAALSPGFSGWQAGRNPQGIVECRKSSGETLVMKEMK